MTAYPHERQIEYSVSRAIEDYFENEGYDVVVLPNSKRMEKVLPYDHLFAGRGIKVFGLQYKRLSNGAQDYWSIDRAQFLQASKFGWIYYALPQITSIRQCRNSLHLLVITPFRNLRDRVNSTSGATLRIMTSDLGIGSGKVSYFRWGGFVQKLVGCTEGWRPSSADELRSVFSNGADILKTMVDIYIVPLAAGPVIRISPFATDIDDVQDGFDFGIER